MDQIAFISIQQKVCQLVMYLLKEISWSLRLQMYGIGLQILKDIIAIILISMLQKNQKKQLLRL